MVKRSVLLVLCLVLLCSPCAQATAPRVSANQPSLAFSGTTANCEFAFTKIGKQIEVTMELWYGSTLVDSWTKEASHTVSFDEECTVARGRTYTLKIVGTCGGEAIVCDPVSKYCP